MRRKAARILETEFNGLKDLLNKTNIADKDLAKLTGWSKGMIASIRKFDNWAEYRENKTKVYRDWVAKYRKAPKGEAVVEEATTYPEAASVVEPNFHTDLGEISKAILFLAEQSEKQTKVLMSMNNFLTAVTTEKKKKLFGF